MARQLNMLITFLLELAMLAAYGFGGYELGNNTVVRWVLAFLFPVIVGVLWGIFLSPRARVQLPYAVKLAARFLLMTGGALILWSAHLTLLATIYTIALLASITLTLLNREIPGEG
jgi:hypothetical protein